MPEQATVYVIDDDADVRDSLRLLLQSSDFRVEVFDSAQAFLEHPHSLHACVVTDVRMPGMDGIALQEELGRRAQALPVIIMTGHGDVPLAVRAMRAGAIDFLEKPFEEEALIASIRRALEVLFVAQSKTAAAEEAAAHLAELTEREREVLDLLVLGKPNKVIAYELDISPRTVEIHRSRVMEKTGARSLADLVRLALATGQMPSAASQAFRQGPDSAS